MKPKGKHGAVQEQKVTVESFHHFPSVAQFHSFKLDVEEGHSKKWKKNHSFTKETRSYFSYIVEIMLRKRRKAPAMFN